MRAWTEGSPMKVGHAYLKNGMKRVFGKRKKEMKRGNALFSLSISRRLPAHFPNIFPFYIIK